MSTSKKKVADTLALAKREPVHEAEIVQPAKLTEEERARLKTHERHVDEAGVRAVNALESLWIIYDQHLHRENNSTFELYCQERFKYTESYSKRLVHGFKMNQIAQEIGEKTGVPIGTIPEHHTRPLRGLKPKKAKKALAIAVKKAKGKKPTANQIAEAAAEVKDKPLARGGLISEALRAERGLPPVPNGSEATNKVGDAPTKSWYPIALKMIEELCEKKKADWNRIPPPAPIAIAGQIQALFR